MTLPETTDGSHTKYWDRKDMRIRGDDTKDGRCFCRCLLTMVSIVTSLRLANSTMMNEEREWEEERCMRRLLPNKQEGMLFFAFGFFMMEIVAAQHEHQDCTVSRGRFYRRVRVTMFVTRPIVRARI